MSNIKRKLIYFCVGVFALLLSYACEAQINSNVKAITFTNADSVAVKNMVASLQAYYGNIGALYYNAQGDTGKFRIFYDSAWHDLSEISGGSGSNLYFKNGLTKQADSLTVYLGGELIQNTTINGGSNNLSVIGDYPPLNFDNSGYVALGDYGVTPSLYVDAVNLSFSSSGAWAGAIYEGDYSANFIDRSLIDKGYDDSHLYGETFTNTPSNGNVPTYNGTNWTFSNPSATPAGSNTQIQFNNSGAFGASANLTWDGTQVSIAGTEYAAGQITANTNYAIVPDNRTGATGFSMNISAGAVTSGVFNGGDLNLSAGNSTSGSVGQIKLDLINNEVFVTTPSNGLINFTGNNTTTNIGESLAIIGGTPTTGNGNGGDVILTRGTPSGSGSYGMIDFTDGSGSLDFGNTLAGNSTDLTVTYNGAASGDMVLLGVPNGSVNANSCFTAWVSAANTVTVRFNNYSASPIDPASGTFKVSVIK